MSKIILVTGGARSGKSAIAEARTLALGRPAIYIATAEPRDGEIRARIATHRARRGPDWSDIEAPFDLSRALMRSDGAGPRLVDCLTLWLTNLMLGGHDVAAAGARLCDTLAEQSAPVVIVTNEVGSGIVPETPLGRAFRDAAGELNQRVAATAHEVVLAVSGLPLQVK
ncbi:bifunctional adenosylcobinamide kinase/adenosylcobinamide-phosphate guanylyltransferase [Palleronia sediminis]|uniref:Bifunctional adenosylcobalamin biosynthesis protein n=1 Tax=Palleronia sediminis TaxID=2547833 RepID=A0A4R6ACN1_9RHOB|nr:bifunctional adenosylcobinamide kinase/adenosylcobinamide-phosphate guanylyltransferase [Palleronia sediminis]TDL81761.1 bifunctional adenosylcobinamide kinase/adenosylcobinamide-phosphate guanylyltransferase [Palleronia sediminis]